VHIIRKQPFSLFYNSLNHKILEFTNESGIDELVKQLLIPSNGYVIPLDDEILSRTGVADFVKQLRLTFMGDLLDASWSKVKPVNLFPRPIVKNLLSTSNTKAEPAGEKIDPRNYIRDITFYLNGETPRILYPMHTAFKQFSYPAIASPQHASLEFESLKFFLQDIRNYKPACIHISGADVSLYPALTEVVTLMSPLPFAKKYHLLLKNYQPDVLTVLLRQSRTVIALYITFPYRPDDITRFLSRIATTAMRTKVEFHFVVSGAEELHTSLQTIQLIDLQNTFFKPWYTGSNDAFLEENVFVSKEDIYDSRPTQKQVFSRLTINEYDFGKFMVTPSGDVFANLNDPKIGTIRNDSAYQLVLNELEHGKSWRRSRKRVSPCKTCRYQFLCPPVSSLEIFRKKFNFCTVYPNPGMP